MSHPEEKKKFIVSLKRNPTQEEEKKGLPENNIPTEVLPAQEKKEDQLKKNDSQVFY